MPESAATPTCSHKGCNREVYRDPGYPATDKCIFHAEKKDPQAFRDALAKQIRDWRRNKATRWDFSGWVFVDVERPNNWGESTYTMFRRSIFLGDVNFKGASFLEPAFFIDSVFSRPADFQSSVFHGTVDFSGTIFVSYANFCETVFKENAGFERTLFSDDALFEKAQFKSIAFFVAASFQGDALFNSAVFDDVVDMRSAHFLEETEISGASFNKICFLGFLVLEGPCNFSGSNFNEEADFESTKFCSNALFDESIFSADVRFWSTLFKSHASFQNCTFKSSLSLWKTTFNGGSDFSYSYFGGDLDFNLCSFAVLGAFDLCNINNHVRLEWPGEGRKPISVTHNVHEKEQTIQPETQTIARGKLLLRKLQFVGKNAVLDLRRNPLEDDARLRIEECDMSRIMLEGTDCRKIEFYAVEWPQPLGFMRRVVGDEWMAAWRKGRRIPQLIWKRWRIWRKGKRSLFNRLRAEVPWHLIGITYQQLASRFRQDFDHVPANDFDRGVFAMRRAAAKKQGGFWGLAGQFQMNLYALASLYGGSVTLPIIWLVLSLFAFAFAYHCTSMSAEVDPFWWNAIAVSIRIATFRRGVLEDLSENSWIVYALMMLQTALTATLVTLLIFAVRRRFKHG